LPFRLINLHGYTPLQAGAAILPMTIVIGLGSVAVGGWLGRQRPGTILGAGAALVSVGLAMLAGGADQSRYLIHWLPALMAIGVGMLMCVTPLTVAAMNSLPDESSGIASGVNNMASRFAGAISIVGMTVLAEMVFSSQDALASAATDENPLASSEAVAGMAAAAFARSYNAVFWTCSALAATAALIALWTLNRRVQPNREAAPS
ncbi:MAG: MFS transporter, partial [Wenzhouxiangellaceae bacterium]